MTQTTLQSGAKITTLLCAIFLAHQLSYCEAGGKSRIYSNVEYIAEGAGDLLGYELEVKVDESRVTGVLRIYEGGCGSPAPISGTLAGNKISLSGKSEVYGMVNISGSMSNESIRATLRLEKVAKPEIIKLKIIPKPHC